MFSCITLNFSAKDEGRRFAYPRKLNLLVLLITQVLLAGNSCISYHHLFELSCISSQPISDRTSTSGIISYTTDSNYGVLAAATCIQWPATKFNFAFAYILLLRSQTASECDAYTYRWTNRQSNTHNIEPPPVKTGVT